MPAITVQKLNEAALDVDHIRDFATSNNPTVTDRFGNTKQSIAGALLEFPNAAAHQAAAAVSSASADASATNASISAGAAADAASAIQASVVSGVVGYATKALMDANLTHGDGEVAYVTNDATLANNGLYRKTGITGAGSWIKGDYDPAAIGRRNGFIVNGQLTKKNYNTDGSFTISHPLFRIELGSGRSFVAVAAVTDLNIPTNRTYYVDLTGAVAASTLTGQVTPTDSLSASYGAGAFVDDLRLALFSNRNTGGNQGCGGLLANTYTPSSNIGQAWFKVVQTTKITYNESTRTLAWDGQIFTPAKLGTSTRVMLDAGSVVIPNLTYEVVYLDLARCVLTQATSPANAIRVGRYTDTSGEQFTGESNQVPLFIRSTIGVFKSVNGFFDPELTVASNPKKVGFVKATDVASNIFIKGAGKNNWIEYIFKKTLVPHDSGATANSQSDFWRIEEAYETNDAKARFHAGNPIIDSGEWGCAIKENGAADYSGGYHGDELQTNGFFLLDGIRYEQDAIVSLDCDEVQHVQLSTLYRCNTTTPIATKTTIHTFTISGIEISNDITWLVSLITAEAYLAMLPIKRQLLDTSGALITDKAIRSPAYALEDVSTTGFTRNYLAAKTGDTVNLHGSVGISASIEMLETPNISTATIDISNLAPYNKFYFNAVGRLVNYTTTINERWKSKARYVITTLN